MSETTRNDLLRVGQQLHQRLDDWFAKTNEAIRQGPGMAFPLSVMLLTSAADDHASSTSWLTLADCPMPDRPNGYAQALYMSRDLLASLAQLDAQFGLGLPLSGVIAAHPLIRAGQDRTVVELVEDKGALGDGK